MTIIYFPLYERIGVWGFLFLYLYIATSITVYTVVEDYINFDFVSGFFTFYVTFWALYIVKIK